MEFKIDPTTLSQYALDLVLDDTGEEPLAALGERERSESALAALRIRGLSMSNDEEKKRAYAWLEVFERLLDSGWPWRIAAYISWASSPRLTRMPKTQEELAKDVLGLTSDRVIATWRAKNPNIDRVISIMQAAPLLEHRADVFKALAMSASMEDHRSNPDRKLFLEITGDYTPKAKLDIDDKRKGGEDLSGLSDAELADLAKQAGVKLKGETE